MTFLQQDRVIAAIRDWPPKFEGSVNMRIAIMQPYFTTVHRCSS